MKQSVVLGIDPSSRKLAAVALDSSNHHWFATFTGKLDPAPLGCAQAYDTIQQWLTELYVEGKEVRRVALEAPVVGRGGIRTTIVQSYIHGSIMAACMFYNPGLPVEVVHPSTWKKEVVGHGNADKPAVAEWVRTNWSKMFQRAGGDQDLLDAAAIAKYGAAVQARGT